ncbi:MAG: ABC transporter permease [Bacteroidota bacterium]|nr:ABC transporter permease [Bacteroidota bacterium]
MKTIITLVRKELIQVFRNKTMLPIIFLLPVIELILLVYAANLNMKDINMVVCDYDKSSVSEKLSNKFSASPFFNVSRVGDVKTARTMIESNDADVILVIPPKFAKALHKENQAKIQFLFDAVNASKAGITAGYCTRIVADFNRSIIVAEKAVNSDLQKFKIIHTGYRFRFNPELDYKIFMAAGIIVILVTVIGFFLSGINLVREKEIGTIEQINVTPIKKYQFIAGKLIPFLIIALFEMVFGLLIAKILFDLPMLGSLWLLLLVTVVYLMSALGLGLLMSNFAQTQQQVMFMSFFFLLVFILMSGIFTSTESMPYWAQQINRLNPVYYFMRIVRGILLKGAAFTDIQREFYALLIYAISASSLAIITYSKKE